MLRCLYMNESGMPAMPPAPPPSYLRPPTGSPLFLSGKPSGFKVELLIAAFIFALIAAGVWFYVLRKPATPTVTLGAAPTGTLLFFSASPKPDLYQYSFDKSSITPVLPPLESNLVAAVISPARDQVLFVESSSTSKVLLRTSLTTGKSTTIASVKDTPSTLSPAWSYDEKQVAYFIPAPPNTQGGGKIGVVSLAKNTTVKLGVPGSPIGFSLDGGLLMSTARGSNGLSFYVTDIKSGSSQRLAQVPAHMMYSAVSADGQYLARHLVKRFVLGTGAGHQRLLERIQRRDHGLALGIEFAV